MSKKKRQNFFDTFMQDLEVDEPPNCYISPESVQPPLSDASIVNDANSNENSNDSELIIETKSNANMSNCQINEANEILRKTYGNSTDSITEDLRNSYGNSTDVLNNKPTEEVPLHNKPTDKPTDSITEDLRNSYGNIKDKEEIKILRKTYGNSTEFLRTKEKKPKFIKAQKNKQNQETSNSIPLSLKLLVGLQRVAFYWIATESKKHGQNDGQGNRISPEINGTILSQMLRKPYKATKDIVYELEKKKFLNKFSTKGGPGGFAQYIINRSIYQDWLHEESHETFEDLLLKFLRKSYGQPTDDSLKILRTTYGSNGNNKQDSNLRTNYGFTTDQSTENPTELASSMYVSNNINTIHTGTENKNPQGPDSWAELREVDFSALERWNIRNNVIESFKKNKWVVSKEQLEDHIERFARYFTEPEFEARRSKILSPLAFFLGSIKIIARGEPDPIQDVKTQIELAQEISMKNRLAELESRKRQFETFEKQLDQYRESEFDHWLSGLSQEQQEKIVAPNKMAQFGSVSYRLLLKSYYTETIWPEFKQTILNGPRA